MSHIFPSSAIRLARYGCFACGLLLLTVLATGCPSPGNREQPTADAPREDSRDVTDGASASTSGLAREGALEVEEDFDSYTPEPTRQVTLLEIRETNTDTLPAMGSDRLEEADPVLRWEDGKLVLSLPPDEIPPTDDSDNLLAEFERAPTPVHVEASAPLESCTLFVRYVVEFQGTGRTGQFEQWFAFADSRGDWVQSYFESADRFRYDPADDVPPFELWLEQIRLAEDASVPIRVDATEANPRLQFGEASHELSQNQPVEISRQQTSAAISQLPLTTAAFDEFEASPEESAEIILPGREFDDVEFTTRITAHFVGQVPLFIEGQAPDANTPEGNE